MPSWWESEYALGQRGVAMPPRVGHAIVRALIPGGLTQILTRQALRVIRGSNAAANAGPIKVEGVTRDLLSSSNPPKKK